MSKECAVINNVVILGRQANETTTTGVASVAGDGVPYLRRFRSATQHHESGFSWARCDETFEVGLSRIESILLTRF